MDKVSCSIILPHPSHVEIPSSFMPYFPSIMDRDFASCMYFSIIHHSLWSANSLLSVIPNCAPFTIVHNFHNSVTHYYLSFLIVCHSPLSVILHCPTIPIISFPIVCHSPLSITIHYLTVALSHCNVTTHCLTFPI